MITEYFKKYGPRPDKVFGVDTRNPLHENPEQYKAHPLGQLLYFLDAEAKKERGQAQISRAHYIKAGHTAAAEAFEEHAKLLRRYILAPEDRDTILAALRVYQSAGGLDSLDGELRDIATCGGEHEGLDNDAIDDLCEHINV